MNDYQKPRPPAWLIVVLVICLVMIAGVVVITQEPVQPPKDEGSQQTALPPQVAQRYTPQFIKYADENVIRVDHFILDEEGNLIRWCAIFVENKESGEEIHCLN